jgi:hypothetical protein
MKRKKEINPEPVLALLQRKNTVEARTTLSLSSAVLESLHPLEKPITIGPPSPSLLNASLARESAH